VYDSLQETKTVYGNKLKSQHVLWLGIPVKVFKQYAKDNDAKRMAEELVHEGRYGTTVFYDGDRNFKRWLLMKYMFHNYYARYKKYYQVNKGQFFD
ncbi:carboxylate--amine ligase, partial [Lactobacillus sp. XV13L]|nr:carboxylate--amine ligase [Lactobacillus sp. XV13L]